MKASQKIHYHGQDYASFADLPAEAREAYRKASASGAVALNRLLDKILVGGHHFAGKRQGRWLYEDVMSVVENNGQVTLPGASQPLFTKRQLKLAAAVGGALALVGLAVAARTIG